MDTDFPPDPGSPRIRFGTEMRRFRELAQLSQSAMAARLGCTQTQVSRLEIAKRTPSRANAEKLDKIFELTDKNHFVGLYRRIVAQQGPQTWYLDWVTEIEPLARVLRTWDPLLVPGLLQTEAYATHVFSHAPRITPDEIEHRTRGRMARQHILARDEPPAIMSLLDESVLYRRVGNAGVMREQLGRLIDVTKHPSLAIQIVDSQCLTGTLGAFTIAELPGGEQDTILADSSAEGQVTSDPEVVSLIWDRYDKLRLWAYPEHASIKMIEEARQKWI